MAQYVEVQRLLEEVAVVEARLSPNERELYRSLKAKYAEPLSIAFDDKVCLEVLLRNVEVRRGFGLDTGESATRSIEMPRKREVPKAED